MIKQFDEAHTLSNRWLESQYGQTDPYTYQDFRLAVQDRLQDYGLTADADAVDKTMSQICQLIIAGRADTLDMALGDIVDEMAERTVA